MKKIPTPANVRTRAIEKMINDTFDFVFVRKIYIMQIVSTHIRFASIDPFHVDLLHFEKRLSSAQFLLLRFVHFILATDTTMNNKYKGREISFPINVKIPFTRNPFRSKSLRFSRFPFVLGQPSVRFMAKSW